MSKSIVYLNVNGNSYTGWKAININLSLENLSGSFYLEMAERGGESGAIQTGYIRPGDPCTISINGKVIITGYIDKLAPSYDAKVHAIGIYGRDRAGDLVDSSVIDITGQFKQQKIEAIIKTICAPFNISVTTDVDTGKYLETFSIDQGATVFQTIQKLCNMRQVLCVSDGKGGIKITRAGDGTAYTALIEGQNILAGRAEYDFSERYQTYLVKGQKQMFDSETPQVAAESEGRFVDDGIKRYRSLLVIADGQVDTAVCQEIAKWESRVRVGKSAQLNITVASFNDGANDIWGINRMVQIQSPLLYVNGSLLISGVNFRLSDEGETTELALTSREAFETMDISKLKKSQMNPFGLGDDDFQFKTGGPGKSNYYPTPVKKGPGS